MSSSDAGISCRGVFERVAGLGFINQGVRVIEVSEGRGAGSNGHHALIDEGARSIGWQGRARRAGGTSGGACGSKAMSGRFSIRCGIRRDHEVLVSAKHRGPHVVVNRAVGACAYVPGLASRCSGSRAESTRLKVRGWLLALDPLRVPKMDFLRCRGGGHAFILPSGPRTPTRVLGTDGGRQPRRPWYSQCDQPASRGSR